MWQLEFWKLEIKFGNFEELFKDENFKKYINTIIITKIIMIK